MVFFNFFYSVNFYCSTGLFSSYQVDGLRLALSTSAVAFVSILEVPTGWHLALFKTFFENSIGIHESLDIISPKQVLVKNHPLALGLNYSFYKSLGWRPDLWKFQIDVFDMFWVFTRCGRKQNACHFIFVVALLCTMDILNISLNFENFEISRFFKFFKSSFYFAFLSKFIDCF